MASGGISNLARCLPHLWVRLRIYPDTSVGVDPARPVRSVLRENWLADHLVLRDIHGAFRRA
jgi:hypothetical protein